jgi:hypothetical protein
MHNIDWINTTRPTVDYSGNADVSSDTLEAYTRQFEQEHNVSNGDDIGGLVVYSDNCVYDYENFYGWVR